jgi:hypothetical protein
MCVSSFGDIAYAASLLETHHGVQIIDSPDEGWRTLAPEGETHFRVGLKNEETCAKIKQ